MKKLEVQKYYKSKGYIEDRYGNLIIKNKYGSIKRLQFKTRVLKISHKLSEEEIQKRGIDVLPNKWYYTNSFYYSKLWVKDGKITNEEK